MRFNKHRSALPLAFALTCALVVSDSRALLTPSATLPDAEFLQSRHALSWVISAQGNHAQRMIRADLMRRLRQQPLPQLPAYESAVALEPAGVPQS